MPEPDRAIDNPAQWGNFWFNSTFNVGYSAIINSGSTQILTILKEAGEFTAVRNAFDVPDQTMWLFTFVRNPYDRALSTWNEINLDLILSPVDKAEQFYNDMLEYHLSARGTLADVGEFHTQFEFLDKINGNERNGGRKANFVGKIETFEADLLTVETQMGVPLSIAPFANATFPDSQGSSMLIDKDTVFADSTYDSYLLYADAYSSQQTKDLIYTIYRDDFDNFSYAQ